MSVTHELRSIGTGWFSFVVTVPHEMSGGELPTSRLSVAVERRDAVGDLGDDRVGTVVAGRGVYRSCGRTGLGRLAVPFAGPVTML